METEGRTLVQGLLETQAMEELRRQTEVGRSPNGKKPLTQEGQKEWGHLGPSWKQEHRRPVSLWSHRGDSAAAERPPETRRKEASPFLPSSISSRCLPMAEWSWGRLTQWNQTSALYSQTGEGVDRAEGKVAQSWHGSPRSSVTMETQWNEWVWEQSQQMFGTLTAQRAGEARR